ncbi:MAG: hypothetical protein HY754_03595 [Nitrospirae bacterium]|nr:hypothetical protein [Nitrospirota bacterium]
MSYRIVTADNFSRELKRLTKKYPSLKQRIKEFSNKLLDNPSIGTPIGHGCCKARLSTTDKPGGKRKGFRIITYIVPKKEIIFLLSIYDKSEVSTLKDWEIKRIIKELD